MGAPCHGVSQTTCLCPDAYVWGYLFLVPQRLTFYGIYHQAPDESCSYASRFLLLTRDSPSQIGLSSRSFVSSFANETSFVPASLPHLINAR